MKMILHSNSLVVIFVGLMELGWAQDVDHPSASRVLSRRRRYVAFPEGSSFSCAGCMTVGLIGQPAPTSVPGTFTFGLNWGIAYELPNTTETLAFHRSKLRKPMAQRRNRRELYGKVEAILDNMGYNGRQCILKTLCETTQRLVPRGPNMVEEMFRTLFTYTWNRKVPGTRSCFLNAKSWVWPKAATCQCFRSLEPYYNTIRLPMTKVLVDEPMEHHIYDSAHRLGVLLENCDVYKCPLSLVDLAQGYYNAPAPSVDALTNPWALLSSNFV